MKENSFEHYVTALPFKLKDNHHYYVRKTATLAEHWMGTKEGNAVLVGTVGLSAYQIALQNGFIGTEQDWLQSLKSIENYTHIQSIPNTIWVGTHPLGRKITAVHVIDTGGNQWECVFDSTTTTFEINVGLAPFAGTAILI